MDKPLRVLQIFASLNVGGAECRMMDVYRKIDKKKVQFDFVTLTDGEQFFESEIKSLGGSIYKIGDPRKKGIFSNIKSLIAVMKINKYIAVHAHTSYHCGVVSLAAKIAGINIRVSHSRTTDTIQTGLFSRLNIQLGKVLIRLFSTDKLCISRKSGEFLFGKRAVKNKEALVLPNAINLNEYENINVQDINLTEMVSDSLIIGHIGRFSPEKNHQLLIDIYQEFNRIKNKSKLVLVGEGVCEAKIKKTVIEKKLTESVIFTGLRRDVPFLLSIFDVLVIPSIHEGLGGIVIEAQAAGIPCVVSEALPEEIDLGLGLIKRISLNASLQEWVDEIDQSIGLKIDNRNLIRKKFREKRYTVEQEILTLLKEVYRISESPEDSYS